MRYLIENPVPAKAQELANSAGIAQSFAKLKKLVEILDNTSDEQVETNINNSEEFKKAFVEPAKKYINDFIKSTDNNKAFVDANYDSISTTLSNLNDLLEDAYPNVYASDFKPIFNSDSAVFLMHDNSQKTPDKKTETQPDTSKVEPVADENGVVDGENPHGADEAPSDLITSPDEKGLEYDEDIGDTSNTPSGTSNTSSNDSIVDYLESKKQPSDFASRTKLAGLNGIKNYKGTAEQNLFLLQKLRYNETDKTDVQKAAPVSSSESPGQGPTITYGKMKYPAYVDMGGGRYRPANPEELNNDGIQLYIPNPKKGQTEYGKPNFVKVRREGSDIRRQSQFGGAVGSASNFIGDLGNTFAKPFRK